MVIGIVPNQSLLIRLMGSVLIEQNSISYALKPIFGEETYQELLKSNVREELHHVPVSSAPICLTEMNT